MRIRRRLRYRVAVALAVFGGAVSLIQAVGVYVVVHSLEERLLDETLSAEMQDHMERRARNPQSIPATTTSIRAYVFPIGSEPPIPSHVAALTPGRDQVVLDGVPYRAAVADQAGERFVILYNQSQLLRREQDLVLLLIVGTVVITGLAGLAGLWLSGRIIAPVTDLVRRAANLRPEQQPEPLAAHYKWEEIRRLAEDFDDYLARLGAFIERERTFTSDVSHELRTPLAVVDGASEVLLSDRELPARSRNQVARIARAAREMTAVTAALLVLAREEGDSTMHPVSCDVATVLREVLDGLSDALKAKPIDLTVDIQAHPTVATERAVLTVVLGNLLRNALAYTHRGAIHVRLDSASFTIIDTGIGIAPSELPRVFDRYYRGEASRGAGIGLALVKRICDRYGWSIGIDSKPDSGTTVCLQFSDPSSAVALAMTGGHGDGRGEQRRQPEE